MIYRLNIQQDVDYYVARRVMRYTDYPRKVVRLLPSVRYVNIFLQEPIGPETKGRRVRSATSGRFIRVPKTKQRPLAAPPPLALTRGYNNEKLNTYFESLLRANKVLDWKFKNALYTCRISERVKKKKVREEEVVMRCIAHTYGGELVNEKAQDLAELAGYVQKLAEDSPNELPKLLCFHGHGNYLTITHRDKIEIEVGRKKITKKKRVRVRTLIGRIQIGQRDIVEDLSIDTELIEKIEGRTRQAFLRDPQIQRLIRREQISEAELVKIIHDHVIEALRNFPLRSYEDLLTDQVTRDLLQHLSRYISPEALIVIYHCHNGRRKNFIQTFANLVKRPVFAYTGLLGWDWHADISFSIETMRKNWTDVINNSMVRCELNYQEEKWTRKQGDWVVATPVTVSATPATVSVNTNQAATFTVEVSEDNKPSKYQWYEDNNPIAGQTAAQLAITKDKAGTYAYYCKITDSIRGIADSNEVRLTVKSASS